MSERTWAGIIAGYLGFALAVGGVFNGQPTLVLILRIFSIALVAMAIVRLRKNPPNPFVSSALAIIATGVGLMLVHLVPLPPAIWQSLPGRDFVTNTLTAAEITPTWMALSLSPPLTHLSLLAILPYLAAFTASLTLSVRERSIPVIAVLIFVVLEVFLGLLQRFQGPTSPFYFYEHSNFDSATGTFANRNTFAALLYVSIPLTWALALQTLRRGSISRYAVIACTALMLTVLILGLSVTGSRAGILLGMLGFLGSSFLSLAQEKNAASLGSRFILIAGIGAVLLVGQFGMLTILRLAETDFVAEYRNQIFATTLRAAWDYFPIGSGFGTFVPIYAMHETPATTIDPYINHAHNDWLELWLEGGLPMALVLVAFLIWIVVSSLRAWRAKDGRHAHFIARAATLSIALLLLHSFVEYPLRTPAIGALFGFLAALVASVPERTSYGVRHVVAHRRALARPSQRATAEKSFL